MFEILQIYRVNVGQQDECVRAAYIFLHINHIQPRARTYRLNSFFFILYFSFGRRFFTLPLTLAMSNFDTHRAHNTQTAHWNNNRLNQRRIEQRLRERNRR